MLFLIPKIEFSFVVAQFTTERNRIEIWYKTTADNREVEVKEMNENVIEFLKNEEMMTCTLCQGRFITKVRELAEKFPDEVEITVENADGSIVAHVPVRFLHLSYRTMSDEARQAAVERARENFGHNNT